jgi:hypothetical protein
MTARRLVFILTCMTLIISLAGCFPHEASSPTDDRAGFFMGIWHGWIAPVSLIVGIFNHDIRIYDPHNTGWWYDLGYYIAIIAGFGGIAFSRRRKKQDWKTT